MKKYRVYVCLMAVSALLLSGCGGSEDVNISDSGNTLVVFNYGDYIDFTTIEMFEEETGIHVEYEQYVTPEDMYTKFQSGNIPYDLICTSDYMIEKMIRNGEANKIDTSSMEYYDNLDETYLEFCRAFDAENEYAVPYFWGTVGILYNTEMVDEEVDSWDTVSYTHLDVYKRQASVSAGFCLSFGHTVLGRLGILGFPCGSDFAADHRLSAPYHKLAPYGQRAFSQ